VCRELQTIAPLAVVVPSFMTIICPRSCGCLSEESATSHSFFLA
jgi:hypothetical protein